MRKMLPTSVCPHPPDGIWVNLVSLRQLACSFTSSLFLTPPRSADRMNVRRREFTDGSVRAEARSMVDVLLASSPFKVGGTIARDTSIFVIHLVRGRRLGTDERLRHKLMQLAPEMAGVDRQCDIQVAPTFTFRRGGEDLPYSRARPSAHTPNAPEITDLVPTFIANDGTPFFKGIGRLILHRASSWLGDMRAGVTSSAPALLYLVGGAR